MINDQFASSATQKWVPGSGVGPGLQVVARLKPGVNLETARAEIETIRADLNRQGIPQNPLYGGKRELIMMALPDRIVGSSRLALVSLLLMLVSALAAYLPARRAVCVDPLIALREE